MHHTLKIKCKFMEAKQSGGKLFEIRLNDRDFKTGDTVSYTTVTGLPFDGIYEIIHVSAHEQRDGWVVFGERAIDQAKAPQWQPPETVPEDKSVWLAYKWYDAIEVSLAHVSDGGIYLECAILPVSSELLGWMKCEVPQPPKEQS